MTKSTVIVTGGSRGIGRAICLSFAAPHTRIYLNYAASTEAAEETCRLVAEAGGEAVAVRVNIVSEKEVQQFFKKVTDETGRIDVLVNNAGITRDGLMVRMSESDWDDVMNTNLKGVFLCTKMAAKVMMKQRSGKIVNITSIVGVTGNPGQVNYSASKAGIIGLTKSSAKELAIRGITVNAVAPGYIKTDMTAKLPERVKEAMTGQIPLGRAGSPEDVASVVAFLASDSADYITGQVIHVSGGMFI